MLRTFTECSATCGQDGTRHRKYECELLSKSKGVGDEFCAHIPEPIFPQPCNRFACGLPTFSWQVSNSWSECTATCGDTGTQYQPYHCVRNQDGVTEDVADMFCSDIKSPKELRACNRIKCADYRWALNGDWFNCNETCGVTGMQLKKPTCQKFENDVFVKDVGIWYCSKQKKPTESRACNRRSCYTYKWDVLDSWGECSHPCGDTGVRIKQAACKNVTYDNRERRVDEAFCAKIDHPGDTEECNRVKCETFEWHIVEDWYPPCPTTCDDSRLTKQQRVVICNQRFHTGQIEQTDEDFCVHKTKPDVSRNCPKLECPLYEWASSGEWTECSTTCGPAAVQTAIVRCYVVHENGSRSVTEEGHCVSTKPSARTRPCDLSQCPTK